MIRTERQLVDELNCEELFVLRLKGAPDELIEDRIDEKDCNRR